jgi:hypothetical protein
MRTSSSWPLLVAGLLSVACDAHGVPTAAASTGAPPAGDPVLVELFTSEGCSSCPPADERLSVLDHAGAGGVPVVVLGMHVDYWDELGWKDTFGSPAWSSRQRDYSRSMGRGNVYTPQAVIDGVDELVGSDAEGATARVQRAAQRPKAKLVLSRGAATGDGELPLAVRVSGLPPVTAGDSVEVLAALTEDHVFDDVKRGENAGRRLALAPVTMSLDSMGKIGGEGGAVTRSLHLPPRSGARDLRVVVFAQERASRRVLGVASAPLARL